MRAYNDKRLGFQKDQKRLDDLENLITPKTLPAYNDETDKVWSYLPYDYLHLISDRTLTKDLCGAAYSPIVANQSIYNTFLALPDLPLAQYSTLKLYHGGLNILWFNAATYFPSGLPDADAKFELINYIMEVANKFTGVAGFPKAKYESHRGSTQTGSIVFSGDVPLAISLQYNEGAINNLPGETKVISTIDAATVGTVERENRLTKADVLYAQLGSTLAGTLPHSPISEMREGKLYIWHKKKFIPSSIKIDYIRRPRKISLTLNQGCELNENVHMEIVVNTARRIAGITKSEVYPNLINENLLKE